MQIAAIFHAYLSTKRIFFFSWTIMTHLFVQKQHESIFEQMFLSQTYQIFVTISKLGFLIPSPFNNHWSRDLEGVAEAEFAFEGFDYAAANHL